MEADLLIKVGVIVVVLGVLWVLPDLGRHRDRALGARRADATDPAMEQIAADAERIRDQIRQAPAGIPVARMRGWIEAYDDVLVTACQSLGLEEQLAELPESAERDVERQRVEHLLEDAGVLSVVKPR